MTRGAARFAARRSRCPGTRLGIRTRRARMNAGSSGAGVRSRSLGRVLGVGWCSSRRGVGWCVAVRRVGSVCIVEGWFAPAVGASGSPGSPTSAYRCLAVRFRVGGLRNDRHSAGFGEKLSGRPVFGIELGGPSRREPTGGWEARPSKTHRRSGPSLGRRSPRTAADPPAWVR